MPATLSPSVRPRPWWRVRLSLRRMMVVVLVLGCVMGWKAPRAAIQRRAVAEVHALGGQVSYEDQVGAQGHLWRLHQPWAPGWVRRWVGDEFFQEVAWVTISGATGSHVDDGSLAVVGQSDRLQGLSIHGTPAPAGAKPAAVITELGLDRLGRLPKLRYRWLHNTGCSGPMVASLSRWSRLESVTIFDRPGGVSSSSLASLARLPRLKHLEVSAMESASVGDLAAIASLTNLESLRIERSPTSDDGVVDLARIASLQIVALPETEFTEATLHDLRSSPRLRQLTFDGSRLSGGALATLGGMPQLQALTVYFDGRGIAPHAGHLVHDVTRRFVDADLVALAASLLTALTMMGMDATDAGVAQLLPGHWFSTLTLSGRGITDESIPFLTAQSTLFTLVLAGTSITDAGLAQLKALGGLQTLSLVDNARLTDGGVAGVAAFPTLRYLTIRQPSVQSGTLDAIRAARSKFGPFNLFQPPD